MLNGHCLQRDCSCGTQKVVSITEKVFIFVQGNFSLLILASLRMNGSRRAPPQNGHIAISILNTSLSRWAQVSGATSSLLLAASSGVLSSTLPLTFFNSVLLTQILYFRLFINEDSMPKETLEHILVYSPRTYSFAPCAWWKALSEVSLHQGSGRGDQAGRCTFRIRVYWPRNWVVTLFQLIKSRNLPG